MAKQLERFFKEHGWIAEMPKNYAHYVELMFDSISERASGYQSFCESKFGERDDLQIVRSEGRNGELELCDPKHDPWYCTENAL